MSFRAIAFVTVLTLLFSGLSFAYELKTHAEFSDNAVNVSSLTHDSTIIENLALNISNLEQRFESLAGFKNIREIIVDGAEFEDQGIRPVTHFFDPVSTLGLNIDILPPFPASPSWALEDDRTYDSPLRQKYSLADAQVALYDALTLPERQTRIDQAAFFFEALGRLIHHVQDMAAPQHTRNDAHFSDKNEDTHLPFERPSLYEKWTEINRGNLPYQMRTGEIYSSLNLTTAREYWTTPDGRGMADYSNAGFVSAGTNFPDSGGFPSPRLSDAEGWTVPDIGPLFEEGGIPVPEECQDPQSPCKMLFVRTEVQDRLSEDLTSVNDFTSTYSMFDDELEERGLERTFSLNRFNFDNAHRFLIPRAVAYSAGLIDFVFRGKLTAEAAERRDGTLRIALSNESSDGNAFSDGVFELWYDDEAGMRHPIGGLHISGAPDAVLGGAFDSGDSMELVAVLPPNVAPDTRFLLTYRGTIGREPGIASVSFKVEPYRSGFAVELPGGSAGYVTWKNEGWTFAPDPEVESGNIDWRGAYVDGKPTETLTWRGPSSRYFDGGQKLFTHQGTIGEWRPVTFRPFVYENGRLFAVAPGRVLGAAITRDSGGKEWLVIVTYEGPRRRIVYRRPNQRSDSNALYDPVTNPDGWQEIGRFSSTPDERWDSPRTPWFFNGDGTAAQTMQPTVLGEGELPPARRVRLELRISDDNVTWINHGNLNEDAHWVNVSSQCVADYTRDEVGNIEGSGMETVLRTGRSVIAVDYQDDREILAILQVDGTSTHDDTRDLDPFQITSSFELSRRELLVVGSRQFELSRLDVSEEYSRRPVGNDLHEHHEYYFSQRRNRIRFMDLREGVVQFGEDNSISDGFYDRLAGQQWFNTQNSLSEKLITNDSSVVTMNEHISGTQSSTFNRSALPVRCPPTPQWQERPLSRYFPDFPQLPVSPSWVSEFILHNYYQVGVKGSVAIDAAGRIFSSQDIVTLPPAPPVISNYLFGAPGQSPSAVIPGAADDANRFEPRVIR